MQFKGQQQWPPLRACWKCKFLDTAPNLLTQKIWVRLKYLHLNKSSRQFWCIIIFENHCSKGKDTQPTPLYTQEGVGRTRRLPQWALLFHTSSINYIDSSLFPFVYWGSELICVRSWKNWLFPPLNQPLWCLFLLEVFFHEFVPVFFCTKFPQI